MGISAFIRGPSVPPDNQGQSPGADQYDISLLIRFRFK